MSSGRLLRVVPSRDGGWDVVGSGSTEPVSRQWSEAEALAQARELLQPQGGAIQVLNEGGFITAHHSIAPPPESPRALWVGFAVQLLVSVIAALTLGLWFHSIVPAGVALGACTGRLVMTLRRLRIGRAQADGVPRT